MEKRSYKRRIYIIDKKFQFKFVSLMLFMMIVAVASVSFVTFYIVWDSVLDAFFFVEEANKMLADIFTRTSVLMIAPVILLMALFSVAGVLYSHKIAGPLYRIKKVWVRNKKWYRPPS